MHICKRKPHFLPPIPQVSLVGITLGSPASLPLPMPTVSLINHRLQFPETYRLLQQLLLGIDSLPIPSLSLNDNAVAVEQISDKHLYR